jgi:hypothetical protein
LTAAGVDARKGVSGDAGLNQAKEALREINQVGDGLLVLLKVHDLKIDAEN